MASSETVALIAAGSVVGGAFLGGLGQVLVSWRQRVHERNQEKVAAYRELLRNLLSMPDLIGEALTLPEDEQGARLRYYASQFALFRADLGLYAPSHIRDIADKDFFMALRATQQKFLSAPHKNPINEWRDLFLTDVQPIIQRLADAMAKDTNVRRR